MSAAISVARSCCGSAPPMATATRTTGVGASAWCRRLVSLDQLHEQIARIAFALPEAGQVALAGGGAMLAYDLVDRPTQVWISSRRTPPT
jgi:hypothetical protein